MRPSFRARPFFIYATCCPRATCGRFAQRRRQLLLQQRLDEPAHPIPDARLTQVKPGLFVLCPLIGRRSRTGLAPACPVSGKDTGSVVWRCFSRARHSAATSWHRTLSVIASRVLGQCFRMRRSKRFTRHRTPCLDGVLPGRSRIATGREVAMS